jgi:hypothetical protein
VSFDTIIPYAAAADLSAKQYHAVKDNGSGAAAAFAAATDAPIGILQNKPAAAGKSCSIAFDGVAKAILGGTVAKGDLVGPDADGKLVKKAWAVGLSGFVIGRAGAAGVSGDIIPVALLACPVRVSPQGTFVSAETTATGSAQNVAHGLGVTPTAVVVVPTEHPGTPDTGAFDVAEGTHTSTNVVLTVTANVKFKVVAFA